MSSAGRCGRQDSLSPRPTAARRPAPSPGLQTGVAARRGHPSRCAGILAGVADLPVWGFSTLVEGIGLRRRNFSSFFFFSFFFSAAFGRSLVVLGIPPSPFLHKALVSGLGDCGIGGRHGAEMAGLVAADGEARDAREGRSSVQVLNLRPEAGRTGKGDPRARSCSGQPVGNFPGARPPWGLSAPDASRRFLGPLRPLLAARQRLRSRSPHPRLPPFPGGFRIWTALQERLQTLPLETPPHSPHESLPSGPPRPAPQSHARSSGQADNEISHLCRGGVGWGGGPSWGC